MPSVTVSSAAPRPAGAARYRLPGRRKAIFVHGCFWHRHGCRNSVLPKARAEWWAEEAGPETLKRDRAAVAALEALGWSVLTVWSAK